FALLANLALLAPLATTSVPISVHRYGITICSRCGIPCVFRGLRGACRIYFPIMPMKPMPTMPMRIISQPLVSPGWRAPARGVFYRQESKCHDAKFVRVVPEYARGPHGTVTVPALPIVYRDRRLREVSAAASRTVRRISSEGSGSTIAG